MAGKLMKKTVPVCILALIACIFVLRPHRFIYNEENSADVDSIEEDPAIVDSIEEEPAIVDIVKKIDTWENGIRFAQWNHPAEIDKGSHKKLMKFQRLIQGC